MFPTKFRAFSFLITKATSTAGNCHPAWCDGGAAVNNPAAKFWVNSVCIRLCNPTAKRQGAKETAQRGRQAGQII